MSGPSPQRTPMLAANWKLHKTASEARAYVEQLRSLLEASGTSEVVLAPGYTTLAAVGEALQGCPVRLAAQHVYWESSGAFTGEVGPSHLSDVGCTYCLVGHSERRQLFGETDDTVRRRVGALLEHHLRPIVCVGETLTQREQNETESVVVRQLEAGLQGIAESQVAETVTLAYEPVWAIGTGRTATPADAQQVHAALRRVLGTAFGAQAAERVRILYGGSVKPANAEALLAQPDIDGALVGGASLDPESFMAIIRAAG